MALSDYSLEKKSDLTALAESIRAKVESMNSMTVPAMKAAVDGMETGGSVPTGSVQIDNYCSFSNRPYVYYTDGTGNEALARIESSDGGCTSLNLQPVKGSVFAIVYDYDTFNWGQMPYGQQGALTCVKNEMSVLVFVLGENDYDGAWGWIEIQNY